LAEIHDLDVTDASNTGRFPENMAPSAVNNGARALEGLLARFYFDLATAPLATLSGSVIQFTSNRTSLTLTGTTSNYIANTLIGFTMGANPITGPASININSIGAISLRDNRGASLSSSMLLAGMRVILVKDGTNDYFRTLLPDLDVARTDAGLLNIVEDTTPQLGGPLDANSQIVRWAKGADLTTATAGALTLGTDGNFFDVNMATAITSIVTQAVGTVVRLQFDQVLTLTYNATNLILPGNDDITTAAGDIAEFVEESAGNWRCTNYQVDATAPGAGGGGWAFLTSTDISNDATANFTAFDASEYDAYLFELMNVVPATDKAFLDLTTSTDGGSSYDTGASDYAWNAWLLYETVDRQDYDAADAHIGLTGNTTASQGVGSAAGEHGVSGQVWVHGPHLAENTSITWQLMWPGGAAAAQPNIIFGGGYRISAADVDALQFLFSSGNLETGTINMYGLKNA